MSETARFKNVLTALNLEAYATPIDEPDTLVMLARISPPTQDLFNAVEARLLYFVEKALVLAAENGADYRVRLSRPFLLKDGKLRFTWDFTIKGNIEAAVTMFESIRVPQLQTVEVRDVETQLVAPTKGKVKPVTVGSL